MKKSNILISLVGLLITGCDSSASVNKESFDTVVDNCMAFLKEKYWQSFDYVKKDINDIYDGYVRVTSGDMMKTFYAYKTLLNDGTFPITSKTLKFNNDDYTYYFRYYAKKRSERFYIEFCRAGETGACDDIDCGTVTYENFERYEIDYDYSTNTVNSISENSGHFYEHIYENDGVYYQNAKMINCDFEKCLDFSNVTDEQRTYFIDDFVNPFKKTFKTAKEVPGDFTKRIRELYDEMFNEEMDWYHEWSNSKNSSFLK